MCNFASLVLTKKHVFVGTTDSHEDIITEHQLYEGTGRVNLLRVEITPPDGDGTKDPAIWKYRVDQDNLPDWYDAEREESRTRAALRASGLALLYADYRAKCALLDVDDWVKLTLLNADRRARRAEIARVL